MAIGTIQKSIFTDIANAIRVQNGGTDTYKPSEMAAAVLALLLAEWGMYHREKY